MDSTQITNLITDQLLNVFGGAILVICGIGLTFSIGIWIFKFGTQKLGIAPPDLHAQLSI